MKNIQTIIFVVTLFINHLAFSEEPVPNRCLPDATLFLKMVKNSSGYVDAGVDGWIKRARVSAWLPEINARTEITDSSKDTKSIEVLQYPEQSQNISKNISYKVEVSWDLSNLIYNGDELRAAREKLYWMEYLFDLLKDATEVYLARKEAYINYFRSKNRDSVIDIQNYDAKLILYTNGKIKRFIKSHCPDFIKKEEK